jgi:hypothetical protein
MNQTEWDCTGICGALNEDGECSLVTQCLDMGNGKVKGGNPHRANGAGSSRLDGHIAVRAMAVMMLMLGFRMLL